MFLEDVHGGATGLSHSTETVTRIGDIREFTDACVSVIIQ